MYLCSFKIISYFIRVTITFKANGTGIAYNLENFTRSGLLSGRQFASLKRYPNTF